MGIGAARLRLAQGRAASGAGEGREHLVQALAGVLGAGAVGTLTAAWTQERAVQSYDTPLEDVPVHAQRANALSGVGIGLGVAGAGVATTAWVVRW